MPKHERLTFVKVTTTELYAFPTNMDGIPDEVIVKEWFHDYPLTAYHATRDTSKVGGCRRLVEAKIVSEAEIGRMFKRKPVAKRAK